MRRICVVTGSRAEFGLLRWLMHRINDSPDFVLQIIATGMHLSPDFGSTYLEIEQDGFVINRKVEMLVSSDTSVGIAKSIGLGTIGFADALNDLNPDLLLVLGDRYELLSAVSAALIARIPVAHLHGGETTQGLLTRLFGINNKNVSHSLCCLNHIFVVFCNLVSHLTPSF